MQIIIGRDAKTSQLNVIIGQQTLRLGAPGSVPQTVSRQHCRITVTEGGTYLVENLKAANITYINNVGVEKKSMRREDSLALGTDRYQVDTKAVFAAIDKAVPKTADIRPLSKVWEDHEEYIINQKIKSARFVAIASSMGIFTIGAMVYTFVFFLHKRWVLGYEMRKKEEKRCENGEFREGKDDFDLKKRYKRM